MSLVLVDTPTSMTHPLYHSSIIFSDILSFLYCLEYLFIKDILFMYSDMFI